MKAFLADNIPYSLDGIQGLVESYNSLFWPLPMAAPLLLIPLFAGVGDSGWRRLLPPWLLAAAWLWCGQVYYAQQLEPMDWSARYAAWLFGIQSLLLVLMPWLPGRGGCAPVGLAPVTGLLLMLLALAGSPILQWLNGVPPQAIAMAGVTPELTLLLTLGWLLHTGAGIGYWVIPAAGSFYSFASGLALGYIPAMLPLPALLIAIIVMSIELVKHRRTI